MVVAITYTDIEYHENATYKMNSKVQMSVSNWQPHLIPLVQPTRCFSYSDSDRGRVNIQISIL